MYRNLTFNFFEEDQQCQNVGEEEISDRELSEILPLPDSSRNPNQTDRNKISSLYLHVHETR